MKLTYPPNRPKLQPALRQTLVARAEMACADVAVNGGSASVFALRKRTKECRGLLRLLRGGWDHAADWDTRLRDAAAKLAPARDAEVMLDSFDKLTARRRAPIEFNSLRAELLNEIDICDEALDPEAIERFATMMAEFQQAVQTLSIQDKTPPLVWDNLVRTWARGQRSYTDATAASDDATAFHDWRKRLKQHWYQARFFKPINHKALRGHIAQVDALARVLGAHNDLDVLRMFLRATCPYDPALVRLEPDLTSARMRLARQALDLGAQLYAQPNPAQDWAQFWQEWRSAKPRSASDPASPA